MPRVNIPEYEPEIDTLTFEFGDKEYTFALETKQLFRLQQDPAIKNAQDNLNEETLPRILRYGLEIRHPDITDDEIMQLVRTPRQVSAVMSAVGDYMRATGPDEDPLDT